MSVDQPRGQPNNAGQFASKGGAPGKKSKAGKKSNPPAPGKAPTNKEVHAAASSAGLKIYRILQRVDSVVAKFVQPALESIIDTPDDFKKFGYSGIGNESIQLDPIRQHFGVGTHLALGILSKAIPLAFIHAKRLLGKLRKRGDSVQLSDTSAGAAAAEVLRAIFKEVFLALGMPEELATAALPPVATLAAYIAQKVRK